MKTGNIGGGRPPTMVMQSSCGMLERAELECCVAHTTAGSFGNRLGSMLLRTNADVATTLVAIKEPRRAQS
jgi:hypothetical protein